MAETWRYRVQDALTLRTRHLRRSFVPRAARLVDTQPRRRKMALVCPWYGPFPRWFDWFLESCRHNPEVDWLIFTDAVHDRAFPENVHRIQTPFSDLVARARECTGLDLRFERPYKLCDLRPAFGQIFADHLVEHAFWGFCDIDVFFGRIRHFLPDRILDKYDVIAGDSTGESGPFTILRNVPELVTAYTRHPEHAALMTAPESRGFDERGFMQLFRETRGASPVQFLFEDLHGHEWCPEAYAWMDGKILEVQDRGGVARFGRERMYFHLYGWKGIRVDFRPEDGVRGFLITETALLPWRPEARNFGPAISRTT